MSRFLRAARCAVGAVVLASGAGDLALAARGACGPRGDIASLAQAAESEVAQRAAAAHGTARPGATTPETGRSVAARERARHVAAARFDSLAWPEGTERLAFENVEGIILVTGTLRGGARDTTGPLVLDTGAGHLALDHDLARLLGIAEAGGAARNAVELASRPLERLSLGARQRDLLSPVLTVDGAIVRAVTDRPVLGLIGQDCFAHEALAIDYAAGRIALVPIPAHGAAAGAARLAAEPRVRASRSRAALAGVLGERAVAVPFDLAGDGKMLVRGRVSNPRPPARSAPLTLVLDTGATKSVLFEPALERRARHHRAWRAVRGLTAPTLFGEAPAALARVPRLELEAVGGALACDDLDAAVMTSDLHSLLSRVVEREVDGLVGYSLLRRHRVVIDYPHRIAWLEPRADEWNDRPWEYSSPGFQLERRDGVPRVVAVALGSPAERAGARPGDVVVRVDGEDAAALDVVALTRRLEGPPGTWIELVLRRDGVERTYRLERRELL